VISGTCHYVPDNQKGLLIYIHRLSAPLFFSLGKAPKRKHGVRYPQLHQFCHHKMQGVPRSQGGLGKRCAVSEKHLA
jgi:hypothetical protein